MARSNKKTLASLPQFAGKIISKTTEIKNLLAAGDIQKIQQKLLRSNKKAIQETYFNKSFTVACMIEQYYMTLLADIKNIPLTYLFDRHENYEKKAEECGYTHLWSSKYASRNKLEPKIDELIYYYNL